jgi:hypothetical protein
MMTAAVFEMLVPIVQTTQCHITEDCSLEKRMFQVYRQSEFGIVDCINVLGSLVRYCNTVGGSTVINYSCEVSVSHAQ